MSDLDALVAELRAMAAVELDLRGPLDPRGAALWDVAAYIAEDYAPRLEERAMQRDMIEGLRSAARDLRAATALPKERP